MDENSRGGFRALRIAVNSRPFGPEVVYPWRSIQAGVGAGTVAAAYLGFDRPDLETP